MPSTVTSAAGIALEAAFNQLLTLDPASSHRAAALEGKNLQISITDMDLTAELLFGNRQVHIHIGKDGADATASLKGSSLNLLRLSSNSTSSFVENDIEVHGDTGFLTEVQQLLTDLDPDWEALLARAVGDIASHQVGNLVRANWRWAANRGRELSRLTSDFLTEELRAIPSAYEVKDFCQQVDELRLDSDRLSQRIAKLQQRANPQP